MPFKIDDGWMIVYDKEAGDRPGLGVISERPWTSRHTIKSLNQLFMVGEDEAITSIEVTSTGIKAHFKKI